MARKHETSILGIPGYVFFPTAGGWTVRSPTGQGYLVNPHLPACTCPDFAARGNDRPCKHIVGVLALIKREIEEAAGERG